MSATRTVLVTGAAGFIGRHVARALAAAEWRVVGLDRAAPPAVKGGEGERAFAAWRQCDLLDEGALQALAREYAFDAVVHLAALLPGAARGELFAVNAGGTSAVLQHAARAGSHLVLLSTGMVYGPQTAPFHEEMGCRPAEPYGQSKLAAETLARSWAEASGSIATILRASVLYGSDAPAGMLLVSLLAALRERKPFAMTAGEQLRDFLHVDDAARAIAAVLDQRAAGTYNLASGESHSVRQAARLAAAIADRPDLLRIGELPYREGEIFDYRLDGGALQRALGWQSRLHLASGLHRMWEEMQ